jgi:hypothetical protein
MNAAFAAKHVARAEVSEQRNGMLVQPLAMGRTARL